MFRLFDWLFVGLIDWCFDYVDGIGWISKRHRDYLPRSDRENRLFKTLSLIQSVLSFESNNPVIACHRLAYHFDSIRIARRQINKEILPLYNAT